MEQAIFGTQDGRIVVGQGPFLTAATPPVEGVAFYLNDFSLTKEEPWRIPASVDLLKPSDLSPKAPEVRWREPQVGGFAEVFREVTGAIAQGIIDKSVPVAVETGVWEGKEVGGFLNRLCHLPPALRAFGVTDQDRGFLGATPEVLFSVEKGVLRTMALAGTAKMEEREVFAVDDKEIREHEFVAQTLIAKLSDLGMVRRFPRDILDLGKLVHFQTLIEVELYRQEDVGTLIRRLHPTPALGPLPRTEETMALLGRWRDRLGCPRHFGAPFGFWERGSFEALVGIRMIGWQGKEVLLPSGCGIIQESRLMNEWRELRLKRESVKELFFGELCQV